MQDISINTIMWFGFNWFPPFAVRMGLKIISPTKTVDWSSISSVVHKNLLFYWCQCTAFKCPICNSRQLSMVWSTLHGNAHSGILWAGRGLSDTLPQCLQWQCPPWLCFSQLECSHILEKVNPSSQESNRKLIIAVSDRQSWQQTFGELAGPVWAPREFGQGRLNLRALSSLASQSAATFLF